MGNEVNFHPIQMEKWPNAEQFYYYTQMASTSYSVTVPLDVTILRKKLKDSGYKFFPTYLYLVTTVINKEELFKVSLKQGVLGYWDSLNPAYPRFHEDDKSTSLLWTEYNKCYEKFYQKYLEDTKQHGNSHGILSLKGVLPANTYIVSCIPWFTFQSFSLHNHGIKDYYFPSFEAGAFVEENGQIKMPLSVTVHHATIDGYQLKVFFEELQDLMNCPDCWM